MLAQANVNDFISQIRFRIREREEAFVRRMNGFYSEAGVTGQTGHLVQRSIDALYEDFDGAIAETLSYLAKSIPRLRLSARELYQCTAQELRQCAIEFKAIISVERLVKFTRVERVQETLRGAFARLDERLDVRLREFVVGLGDNVDSPRSTSPGAPFKTLSLTQHRKGLLEAILRDLSVSGTDVFIPSTIVEEYRLPISGGHLLLVLRELEQEELIEPVIEPSSYIPRDDRQNEEFILTWDGAREAEGLLQERHLVPASNRYVTLSDNERCAIVADLAALSEEVRGDNEADEEARLIALSEIAAFERTIVQSRVSTELVQRFVDSVLAAIGRAFAKAAVGEIAKRLVQMLIRVIS